MQDSHYSICKGEGRIAGGIVGNKNHFGKGKAPHQSDIKSQQEEDRHRKRVGRNISRDVR